MATIDGTVTPFPTPPSTADPANFDTRADAFLGQFTTFETEINGIIEEINQISITAIGYSQSFIDNNSSTLTFTFASDADDTLSTTENEYGYIAINNGVITADRNLIVSDRQRDITVTNNNTFNVTIKTLSGAGIKVYTGETLNLRCDGTNVVLIEDWTGVSVSQSRIEDLGVVFGTGSVFASAKIYPDQSIIGSNNLGRFTIYPNGNLEIERLITASTSDGSAIVVPIEIVGNYDINPSSQGSSDRIITTEAVTSTGFSVVFRNSSGASVSITNFTYSIKGRWKA